MISFKNFTTLLLLLFFTFSAIANCPNSISGYTYLGEFADHKYFISNTSSNWNTAQANAVANGGYLASISTQQENDLIFNNINEIVFIGLNDIDIEGNLEWDGGDNYAFTKFADTNSASKDYGKMNNWNGNWGLDNQYVSRKSILEIPCSPGPIQSNFTLICPSDLTIEVPQGSSTAVLIWDEPTYDTDCSATGFVTIIQAGGPDLGNALLPGSYDITYYGYDACSTDDYCTFNVEVVDGSTSDNITITSCPNPIIETAPHSGGPYEAFIDWDLPTATTDCTNGGLTLTQISGSAPGFISPVTGDGILIEYQFTDACGNSKICSFTYQVDPEATIITCVDDITIEATSSSGAVLSYPQPLLLSYCTPGAYQVFSGLPSGSEFPIGTSTIEHGYPLNGNSAICQNDAVCDINITVTPLGGGSGDCSDDISGFTTLGEYGNSKYYLSNGNAQPAAAQAEAVSHGGYLAVIGSSGENNFIQQNIDIMPYIGLNDVASEGNLQWVNGEALTYNNVDPCGFCEENSASKDYVIMAPWNGKWSFSSQWNARPYVMEIPCDGSGGGSGLPDLTLSNITNFNTPTTAGAVVNFNIDLNNIGNAVASGDYNIVFLSVTANGLNPINVGTIPTGNTPVGTITSIPASITVPNNYADGNYFIVAVVDHDFDITESDENNNQFVFPYAVGSTGGGNCNNPPTISGFTYKTSVGNKAYYLSNDTDRPTDAEAACVSAGGHLATVNTSEINEALKQFTNGLVYIGLNDEDTEGTLQWRSGESVGYTNFDNCSICEPNSVNKDYVTMQGWNGEWSWSGFYNGRKYWLEVDCNSFNSNNNSTLIVLPTNGEKELLDFQKIVPNPATNYIFVQIKSETEIPIEVEVYDARGMLLKSQSAELFDGINAVEVDIADLPGGFYLVKIPQLKGQDATKRFVKVRD